MRDLDSFWRMSDAGLTDRQPSIVEFFNSLEEIEVVRDADAMFRSVRS
ncbi:hypothetical protein [Ensifer sp. SSB1]|jgi:hypothetical protein|nr:hypothetical protein [Ensifer sp. SSB1]MBK5569627.1 hypothetical protein [Ensifer sp. SSB1]